MQGGPYQIARAEGFHDDAVQFLEDGGVAVDLVVLLVAGAPAVHQAGFLQAGQLALHRAGAAGGQRDDLIGVKGTVGLAIEHGQHALLRLGE
ncbi:hypothetical protein D3C85_1589710 [compost metagenome]